MTPFVANQKGNFSLAEILRATAPPGLAAVSPHRARP
jgi:hypothetical protein